MDLNINIPEDVFRIVCDETLKTGVTTAILVTLRMSCDQFGLQQTNGLLTMLDLCVYYALIFSIWPFVPAIGPSNSVNEATQKSCKGYMYRVLVNFLLLIVFIIFCESVLGYNGMRNIPQRGMIHYVWIYFGLIIPSKMAVNICKLPHKRLLEDIRESLRNRRRVFAEILRDQNEVLTDGDDETGGINGETENAIMNDELWKTFMFTILLTVIHLYFIKVDEELNNLAFIPLYLTILILSICPFGFDLEPEAQPAHQTWMKFLRVLVNIQVVLSTRFYQAVVMFEMDGPITIDFYMKVVYVTTSHLIIFSICRLLINTCRVYCLLLFRANFHTMDLFRVGADEVLKIASSVIILSVILVTFNLLSIRSRGIITMLKICFSLAFLLNVYPLGIETGTTSNVYERTQKSFEALLTRIFVHFFLLFSTPSMLNSGGELFHKNEPAVKTPDWIARGIIGYVVFFIFIRMMVNILVTDERRGTIRRDQNGNIDIYYAGNETLFDETGRKIMVDEIWKMCLASLILASLQLGFNAFGFEGESLFLTLYSIILPIFCFVPFGYVMEPDASLEERAKDYFLRFVGVAISIYLTLMFWEAHSYIRAPEFTNPELFVKKMNESDLVMKFVFLLMSHFILFSVCRLGVILLQAICRLFLMFRVSIRVV